MKRTDSNHQACRDALRACGWYVRDLSAVGHGWPDLLAIKAGRVVFVEVKDGKQPPSRRKLTVAEEWVHFDLKVNGADVYVMEDATDLSYFERPRTDRRSYDERQIPAADAARGTAQD